MVRAVTFWTPSGGGGKTTLAMNLAHALERDGQRVLVWDVDHQRSSLTDAVGLTDRLIEKQGSAPEAVLSDNLSLSECVVDSDDQPGLPFDVIPGSLEWENFDKRIAREPIPNEWTLFRQQLAESGLPSAYDVLIIDGEGARGLKEKNALTATGRAIVPAEPNRKGRNDVGEARDYIQTQIKEPLQQTGYDDFPLSVAQVIANKVESTNVHDDTVDFLRDRDDVPLYPEAFRDRGPYEAALDREMTLFQFAESNETRDLYDYEPEVLAKYERLAEALMNDFKHTHPIEQ